MANVITAADDNGERVALRALLKRLADIELDEFNPAVLGGRMAPFIESRFSDLGDLFQTLEKCQLYFLPQPELERMRRWAEDALELFERTKMNKLPGAERSDLIVRCETLYNECFLPISSAVTYWTLKETDVTERARGLDANVKKVAETRTEVEQILRDVKEDVQKATVAKEAVHFKDEAIIHKRASYLWLLAAGVLAALTLAFAWNAYVTYEEFLKAAASQQTNPISTGQSIQLSIAKLLFFSLLVGAVVWIGRIYRAHRHNYVLNRHRQNALGTFNTFVDSAHDAQTKSAVLLQATQAIFVIQPTGYISQEMDSGGLPQILEVVKTVIQGSSAKS